MHMYICLNIYTFPSGTKMEDCRNDNITFILSQQNEFAKFFY